MNRIREILFRPWARRGVLILYTAILTAVVAIYIGVSLLDVQTSAYIRGDHTLEMGEPNPIRGVLLDAPTGNVRPGVEVTFSLLPKRGGGEETDAALGRRMRKEGIAVGKLSARRAGVVQGPLRLPADVEPGAWELALRAEGSEMEPFVASTEVEVVEEGEATSAGVPWPVRTSRISNEERREEFESGPVEEQSGEVAIDVLPFDGEIPRGLSGRVFVRTYDAETGEPLPATVRFEQIEGMGRWGRRAELPSEIETGSLGLARVPLRAVGGQKWHLRAETKGADSGSGEGGRWGEATLLIHTVASQVSVDLERPLVAGNRLVRGRAESLFRTGALFLDAYRGDRWLVAERASIRDRAARFEFALPEAREGRWLYRVQTYRGYYDAGHSWDARYVVDGAALGGLSTRDAVDRVANFIGGHRTEDPYFQYVTEENLAETANAEPTRDEMWLRAYLAAIPRSFRSSEDLFNTRPEDQKALEAWKDDIQSELMLAVLVGLLGGFAVLLYVVVAGVRRNREHESRLRDVDEELAAASLEAGDGDPSVEPGMSAKIQAGLLGFVGLATFVMFALGLVLLLSYL